MDSPKALNSSLMVEIKRTLKSYRPYGPYFLILVNLSPMEQFDVVTSIMTWAQNSLVIRNVWSKSFIDNYTGFSIHSVVCVCVHINLLRKGKNMGAGSDEEKRIGKEKKNIKAKKEKRGLL